jgi:hypothetical protein
MLFVCMLLLLLLSAGLQGVQEHWLWRHPLSTSLRQGPGAHADCVPAAAAADCVPAPAAAVLRFSLAILHERWLW